jgi:small GTP-binding protein
MINKISTIDGEKMLLFKVLLCGNSSTGKTSLIKKYIDNEINENTISTIGVDYNSKIFKIKEKLIKIMIWDTAGQERFRSIISCYFKGAHGIILVFDISSKKTFDDLSYWMDTIFTYGELDKNLILIGNKTDLERNVSFEEANKFALDNNMKYYETNIYDNKIDDIFLQIVNDIYERYEKDTNKNDWNTVTNTLKLDNVRSRYCCY